ncbi:hypothetical protein [Nocardia terpenica]|uniref:Tail assembly chaperone n=1 Tax=Nocardia terpenica TaxID=455432 RepID=A0A164LAW2_9NOCA|nr:hypothetical protein [Nocardia terpenica]KZM72202.1 hypothetical protein AWN90_36610 [Nocardia terpenica]NQE86654.1 hypothetical protein [Nocardia terpenica]
MAATKAQKKSSASSESNWARLVREATKDRKQFEPYVFDAYDPPVLITPPTGLERQLMLARLSDEAGSVEPDDLPEMLAALVGEAAFAKVWDALRDQPLDVTLALIEDINRHFNKGADGGAEEFPGGDSAS